MRILVVSDTHGDLNTLLKVVRAQPSAEIIVHCGDGENQAQYIKENFKDKMVVAVRGNCDWGSSLLSTEIFKVCGKKIFVTHGHLYNAKISLYNLTCAAKEEKADILLFGHTHIPLSTYECGVHILNPGSCSGYRATYGFVDIDEKGNIVTNTVAVK